MPPSKTTRTKAKTPKRPDAALRHALKRLRDVEYALDQSAIVAATDARGRITHVNEMFRKISKYSRDELLGKDHRIINSGYHSKKFMQTLWETITAGNIWRGEMYNRAKDGTFYWVDTTIVPFLETSGKPYQYLAIRFEITKRKQAEAALLEQNSLARLGEMAAVVAHEVKNPLAGIGGAIQIIGGRLPETSSDRPIIKEILDRIASLNETVEDLLLYARPKPLKIQSTEIRAVIESSAALLAGDPAFGKVEVFFRGEDYRLQADPDLLRQVIVNLLLNASQAMGGKGTIQVKSALSDGVAQVSVSDTGPGIPPAIREKIFEPFFTTKHRGTGLGLALAKRVLELHGGTISASCPAGGGTCMSITLPNAGAARPDAG